MSAVLKYTVVRNHPDTGVATVLKVGEPVPEWAEKLVHEDDLTEATALPKPESDDSADGGDAKAAEAALEELKAANDRISDLEVELKTVTAEKFAALGHPAGDPAETWKVAELEAYAAHKGFDVSGAKNNGERVALIAAAN